MAQRTVTTYVDDLTGQSGSEVARHTFSLDGVDYEIDLSPDSYQVLLDILAPYFRCGRKPRARHSARKVQPKLPAEPMKPHLASS